MEKYWKPQNTKHCIATDRFLRAHGINNAKMPKNLQPKRRKNI
jgi:hypothetical protein